jgi:hypothetical protein
VTTKNSTKAASAAYRKLVRQRRQVSRNLLETLRRQSRQIDYGFFRRETAPELYDLAMTAKDRRGKSLKFGGLVFPLSYGWATRVHDPVTDEVLVTVSGLW